MRHFRQPLPPLAAPRAAIVGGIRALPLCFAFRCPMLAGLVRAGLATATAEKGAVRPEGDKGGALADHRRGPEGDRRLTYVNVTCTPLLYVDYRVGVRGKPAW